MIKRIRDLKSLVNAGASKYYISLATVCYELKLTKDLIVKSLSKQELELLKHWIETNIFYDRDRRNVRELLERLDYSFKEMTMFVENKISIEFISPDTNPNIAQAKERLKNGV